MCYFFGVSGVFQSSKLSAVVFVNGEETKTVDISTVNDKEIYSVESNGYHLQIAFYNDGVQIETADCKDKLCVKTGKLTKQGQCAVCLPARVSVQITGGNSSTADAIAG